jgi:hypothetical protein
VPGEPYRNSDGLRLLASYLWIAEDRINASAKLVAGHSDPARRDSSSLSAFDLARRPKRRTATRAAGTDRASWRCDAVLGRVLGRSGSVCKSGGAEHQGSEVR